MKSHFHFGVIGTVAGKKCLVAVTFGGPKLRRARNGLSEVEDSAMMAAHWGALHQII